MAHIFAEILEWSKTLTPWQNEAIRRLFRNGNLSQADKDEVFRLAKIEHKLEPPPEIAQDLMLKSAELPAPPVDGAKIHLKGLRELVNVNTLKNDQHLSIGKQFTGIYGDNAAGKSGYARVTKRACRARAVDPILPDIYGAAATQPPSAIFEIEENSVVRDEKWIEGIPSPECLGRFAVFDSKCARVYVSENNELSFLPYGFDIIKGVAAVTDEIKKLFQGHGKLPNAEILKPFLDDTSVGNQLKALTVDTDEATIKNLGDWTADDATELAAKETELATLKAKSPQAIRDALTAEKNHLETILANANGLMAAVSEAKLSDVKNKAGAVQKFEQAVTAAAQVAFGGMNLPGIGGDAWRELILSAATFSTKEAYLNQSFPATADDAKCVLCLQPLDGGSRDRLKKFWDFIKDDTSKKRDDAKTLLAGEITALKNVPRDVPKEISVLKDALHAAGSKVYDLLPPFYQSVGVRVKSIEEAVVSKTWETIESLPNSPVEQVESEVAAIDNRLKELQDDSKIAGVIQTLTKAIAELVARQRLNTHLSSILDYLAALKTATLASQAAGKITTNAISLKSSELQNKFVTDEFINAVNTELAAFKLPRVKPTVEKKSEKGKVLFKLNVNGGKNISPESVFSESERTAISMACFLAELAIGKDNCGIILDDPVSSLSHRVRERIVNRLVSEAKSRQVIVFTHDLVFHRELVAACERQQTAFHFQCIESLGATTGIVHDTPPWSAMKVSQRVSKIDKMLADLRKAEATGDVKLYRDLFGDFYAALRSTWERAVEEVLFNQVVQRLEKEVKTMRLDGVSVDSESVQAVFDGMTQASKMIDAHDHAVAENSSLPNVDDIAKDLTAFKDFIAKQNQKRNQAERQNVHLKK